MYLWLYKSIYKRYLRQDAEQALLVFAKMMKMRGNSPV